jgi:hypothetical protein
LVAAEAAARRAQPVRHIGVGRGCLKNSLGRLQ